MRLLRFASFGTLLIFALGCHSRQQTSVAAGAASISASAVGATTVIANAVGPIPGAPENVQYRTNPYSTDPVAPQDGRLLFDWYNLALVRKPEEGGADPCVS